MSTTTEVNAFWLKAITAEMALSYATGLKNSHGSPFTQFRKVFPELPKNKAVALLWVKELFEYNEIELGKYFLSVVNTIK
jgi:hypothetical protein